MLANKTALITGGSQGLGLAIARAYVTAGANVVLCARDEKNLREAEEELRMLAKKGQKIVAHVADVSKKKDVEKIVGVTLETFNQLHILVNNAGIYGPKSKIEEVDWDAWKEAIEINLYGSILMCRAVIPHFKVQRYGKVIQVSGGGATKPMPYFSAYAASKAAVTRFAETLAEEIKEYQIDVNAIAPGALNTRFLDEVLKAGPEKVGKAFYEQSLRQKENGGAPLEKGAKLALFLASNASDGITGKLISAIWDPWEELPSKLDDLQSDIYTLRRIVPKDRGMDWGI